MAAVTKAVSEQENAVASTPEEQLKLALAITGLSEAEFHKKKYDAGVICSNVEDEKKLPAPVDVLPGIKEVTGYAYDRKNKSDQLKGLYVSYEYDPKLVGLSELAEFVAKTYEVESPEAYIVNGFATFQGTKSRNTKATELRKTREDAGDPVARTLRKLREMAKPGKKNSKIINDELMAIFAKLDAMGEDEDEDNE